MHAHIFFVFVEWISENLATTHVALNVGKLKGKAFAEDKLFPLELTTEVAFKNLSEFRNVGRRSERIRQGLPLMTKYEGLWLSD